MEACRGEQNLWKLCLTLDMYFLPQVEQIRNEKFDFKVPCLLIQSHGFLDGMCKMAFGYDKGLEDFSQLTKSVVKQSGSNNVDSMLILDSGHCDQFDPVFYMAWIFALQNVPFKGSFQKKQGSQAQFAECLGMLWLQYLYRMNHHNDTIDYEAISPRIEQFKALYKYEHQL